MKLDKKICLLMALILCLGVFPVSVFADGSFAIEAQEKLASEKRIELLFLHRKSSRIIICKNSIAKIISIT